jgi:hypothetical protein
VRVSEAPEKVLPLVILNEVKDGFFGKEPGNVGCFISFGMTVRGSHDVRNGFAAWNRRAHLNGQSPFCAGYPPSV